MNITNHSISVNLRSVIVTPSTPPHPDNSFLYWTVLTYTHFLLPYFENSDFVQLAPLFPTHLLLWRWIWTSTLGKSWLVLTVILCPLPVVDLGLSTWPNHARIKEKFIRSNQESLSLLAGQVSRNDPLSGWCHTWIDNRSGIAVTILLSSLE